MVDTDRLVEDDEDCCQLPPAQPLHAQPLPTWHVSDREIQVSPQAFPSLHTLQQVPVGLSPLHAVIPWENDVNRKNRGISHFALCLAFMGLIRGGVHLPSWSALAVVVIGGGVSVFPSLVR